MPEKPTTPPAPIETPSERTDSDAPAPKSDLSPTVQTLLYATPLAVIGLVYADSFRAMAAVWWVDPNYGYCFLVPAFSAFFAYVCWERHGWAARGDVNRDEVISGAIVAALGLLIHYFAVVVNNPVVDVIGLIVILRGMIDAIGGREAKRNYAFPVLFLIFMAPLPTMWYQPLALFMQQLTSGAAWFVFNLLGVAVSRDGYFLYLPIEAPHNVMEVGAACNGMRGLTAIFALGAVIAFFGRDRSATYRWAVILTAPVVAIVANCIRVVLTGFIIMWIDVKYAKDEYHEMGGLVVIVIAAVILMMIANGFAKLDELWSKSATAGPDGEKETSP